MSRPRMRAPTLGNEVSLFQWSLNRYCSIVSFAFPLCSRARERSHWCNVNFEKKVSPLFELEHVTEHNAQVRDGNYNRRRCSTHFSNLAVSSTERTNVVCCDLRTHPGYHGIIAPRGGAHVAATLGQLRSVKFSSLQCTFTCRRCRCRHEETEFKWTKLFRLTICTAMLFRTKYCVNRINFTKSGRQRLNSNFINFVVWWRISNTLCM